MWAESIHAIIFQWHMKPPPLRLRLWDICFYSIQSDPYTEIKDEVVSSNNGRFMTQEDIIEDVLSDPNYTYLRTVKPTKGE